MIRKTHLNFWLRWAKNLDFFYFAVCITFLPSSLFLCFGPSSSKSLSPQVLGVCLYWPFYGWHGILWQPVFPWRSNSFIQPCNGVVIINVGGWEADIHIYTYTNQWFINLVFKYFSKRFSCNIYINYKEGA